jgi:hypothetical protein
MKAFVLATLRVLIVLAIVLSTLLFVWPTRFRYDHMTVDGNLVPVRIDRLTGNADMLVPDDGWVPVEAPRDATPESPHSEKS